MELIIKLDRILVFLLIAGILAIVTRRLRVPYTVGLVLTGIMLSFFPFFGRVPLSKDLIFNVFLPPLVFEAALQIHWRELRRELPVVVTLATIGVCLSWGVTALGMHYLAGWEWIGALFFGALIAATDPVSVIATFKEARIHGRLGLLVEAESLFNDGTAAVAFGIMVIAAAGNILSVSGVAKTLGISVVGGILCGGLMAAALLLLAGQTEDPLVEITFTTFTAYASFLLAEKFHASGVLACLTAGLVIGNIGALGAISPRGREAVAAYWEYIGFVANSLIFMDIGIHLSQQDLGGILVPAVSAILLVILGRALTVYPCCVLFSRSALHVQGRHQHVLFWGGLRGGLALALALGLPPDVPHRNTIISVSFVVVSFSIFVQGLTMTPFLRKMGEMPSPIKN
jgi:CPA1 family monovalent cation:H+ antiporter